MHEFVAWLAVYFYIGAVFCVVDFVDVLVARFLFNREEYSARAIILYPVFTLFLWPLQLLATIAAVVTPGFYKHVTKSALRVAESWATPYFAYEFESEPSLDQIKELSQHIWRTNPGWHLGDPIDLFLYRKKKNGSKVYVGFERKDKCASHKCFRHIRATSPIDTKYEEVWNAG